MQTNGFNKSGFKNRKYEQVCATMKEEGYQMLSPEWTGFRSYYNVRCPKGHEYPVQWAEFHRGTRCGTCHHESLTVKNPSFKGKSRNEHRTHMDTVFKSQLNDEGYTFDARFKYKNNQSKLPVKCEKGHDWSVNWNSWSGGKRCRQCFEERARLSNEQVAKELEVEGCELVGDYRGSEKPFKYVCSCGNKSMIRIGDFRAGVRCARCAGDKAKETMRLKRLEKLNEKFGAR